nr:unnamed protein product [Callosobruchus chinensis]
MMPLMYAILKDARADLEEASKRIDEGKRVVNEYSRMHNLNMYDGVELRNSNRNQVLVSAHLSTDLLEDCLKLLERLKQPWVAMPLLYVILEDARADLEEASKRIDEGKRAVNEYSRMHNINMYKGAELRNSAILVVILIEVLVAAHQSTDLLDGCRKLLERFKYAWDMMPLIYAILKDARADLDEASRRIDEGQYNNWYRHVIQTSMFVAFRANGPSSNGFFRTK